jgi:anti-sigma factor RsiW
VNVPAPCAKAVHQLWDYLDGDLDDVQRRDLDRHLTWCLRCCGEVAFARELRRRLATDPGPLPTDVGDRLERFLDELARSSEPPGTYPVVPADRPPTERGTR